MEKIAHMMNIRSLLMIGRLDVKNRQISVHGQSAIMKICKKHINKCLRRAVFTVLFSIRKKLLKKLLTTNKG